MRFLPVLSFLFLCRVRSHVLINLTKNHDEFRRFYKFWTNTGFCPMGETRIPSSISNFLLSDEVRMNLELIGALPNGALYNVRIHWLLDLIEFVKFQKSGIPLYDFTKLDTFLEWINEANLSIDFEFMGNPGGIFSKNSSAAELLWEDLVFQISARYLKRFGVDKLLQWRFETWNEPDLKTYNLPNFTVKEYQQYVAAIRRGLDAAERTTQGIHIELRGPAGLFKSKTTHKLCWAALEECNKPGKCFFDVLTFHRKGQGTADEIVHGGQSLISEILKEYQNLENIKFSNNEADPVSGWSTPRTFQSDVRYASILTLTVLQHWSAKLNDQKFSNLESISHDNAFLSYHPYEFHQRTLIACFRMNLTRPPYFQFIQKPVYVALGLLGNAAEYARDITQIQELNMTYLVTSGHPNAPFYSAVFIVTDGKSPRRYIKFKFIIPKARSGEMFAYMIEAIETDVTDPVKIWQYYGSPPYPNATIREIMRSVQSPKILSHQVLKSNPQHFKVKLSMRTPWIALIRICSSLISPPLQPKNVRVRKLTAGEVLIFWSEIFIPERCYKSYEVWFRSNIRNIWEVISGSQHIPFLSYQYAPIKRLVFGCYKVRAFDIFGRYGEFSKIVCFNCTTPN